MSAATAKYGILVGVDGSAQSNAAVAWAAREAVMRQLPITLLHMLPLWLSAGRWASCTRI